MDPGMQMKHIFIQPKPPLRLPMSHINDCFLTTGIVLQQLSEILHTLHDRPESFESDSKVMCLSRLVIG